jgi:hypothetical protein
VSKRGKLEINFANATKAESQMQIVFAKKFAPGVYKISKEETGFGVAQNIPPKLNAQNTFIVENDEENPIETFTDFLLKVATVELHGSDVLWEYLINFDLMQLPNRECDAKCTRLLVVLVCHFGTEGNSNWHKLLERINLDFLTGEIRTSLLLILQRPPSPDEPMLPLPDEQFKICYEALRLNLAVLPAGEKRTTIPQISEYYPADALLFRLQAQSAVRNAENILGEAIANENFDFTEAFGKTSEFYDMYNWHDKQFNIDLRRNSETAHPPLIHEKNPGGVDFFGATFVDLLVRRERLSPIFSKCYVQVRHMDNDMEMLAEQLRQNYPDLHKHIKGRDYRQDGSYERELYSLFYFNAVAAIAHIYGICETKTATHYLVHMMELFPELVRRDLLICQWMKHKGAENNATAPA